MVEGATGMLRADAVRKSFGDHEVLKGVSLEIAEGEVVCLIGASGSGKSTLLRCLNLLEQVDDGDIWFDGREITDPRIDVDAVRRDIGIVFQAYNLFPHLRVIDNVTLAPRRVHGVSRERATHEATEMLRRVGLLDKARAWPDELSGGQQQRVAVARALVTSPVLMLLDEVTSALDPELVGEVLAMLSDLKDEGTTMLVATHEMSFARDVADTVVFLDGGTVCEQGPAQQVLGDPVQPRTQQFLRRIVDAGRL